MGSMNRPPIVWRAGAAALATVLLAPGCGGGGGSGDGGIDGEGGAAEVITIDLSAPRTPRQLDPSGKNLDMATIDGPADFTVRLPARTISGRFRAVNVYGPLTVDESVPADHPARAVSTLDLRYEFTDDAGEVLSRLERITTEFDMTPADRAALDAFADEFRAATDAREGEIVDDDFVDGTEIREFRVVGTGVDGVSLQVRFMGGADVAMTLFVGFDNGVS